MLFIFFRAASKPLSSQFASTTAIQKKYPQATVTKNLMSIRIKSNP